MLNIENTIIDPVDSTAKNVEKNLIKRLIHACVGEKLLPYTISENNLFIYLNNSNQTIIANDVKFYNLSKFKIIGEVFLKSENKSFVLENVRDFLSLIYQELIDSLDLDKWQNFIKEINNCLENDILVTKYMADFNVNLENDITKFNCNSLTEYVSKHYSTAQQLAFFESWASKGHPYHPCHKTKLGFSKDDYIKYSPEFHQDIHIPLAAVKKRIMHVESSESNFDYNHWFSTEYPEQWSEFQKKINSMQLIVDEYHPIFIHAWQYENIVKSLFHTLIENKQLILLRGLGIITKASLSFRTLMLKDNPKQAHIKIPVAVHSTSALRIINPASIENGPKLTKIFKQILNMQNTFSQYIKFAYDDHALRIIDNNIEATKHLAIIYRRNPVSLVSKNQIPIVVAALCQQSPINQLPLFIEIMHLAVGDTLVAAIQYFDKYCHIVLRAYLDLFLIYGIALEGHQQNTIAVFDKYDPVYMIARDFGALRIHAPTFQKQGFDFKPFPNSSIITDNISHVTSKFLDTVIQYHLGSIILLLADYYEVSENIFWKIIKNHIEKTFENLKDKVNPEYWHKTYEAILQDDWQTLGFLRMRLNTNHNNYIFAHTKNPLRDI